MGVDAGGEGGETGEVAGGAVVVDFGARVLRGCFGVVGSE